MHIHTHTYTYMCIYKHICTYLHIQDKRNSTYKTFTDCVEFDKHTISIYFLTESSFFCFSVYVYIKAIIFIY